jgi:hypothetical protein
LEVPSVKVQIPTEESKPIVVAETVVNEPIITKTQVTQKEVATPIVPELKFLYYL